MIFAEDELQKEQENDSTVKEITTVQIDEKCREGDLSEAEPQHKEQEAEANDIEVR